MKDFSEIMSGMKEKPMSVSDVDFSSVSDTNKWMMENTYKTGWHCQEMFEWFFTVNEVPVNEMPDYCCIPMMCELNRNYRFRYRVFVDDEGVGYLCMLKKRDPIGHPVKYGLSYRILPSVKGHSVERIMELMKGLGVEDIIGFDEKSAFNWNFYNTKEDAKRYVRRKWQTRHGVHTLDDRIKVLDSAKGDDVFGSKELVEGFNEVVTGWYAHQKASGKKMDLMVPKYAKDIYRIMIFLLDGKVAGYCAITKMCGHWFSMVNKNSSKFGEMDEYAARRIGHFITWYRHEEFMKDEKAEGLFCFGVTRDEKQLLEWKRMTYGHAVPYSRTKI